MTKTEVLAAINAAGISLDDDRAKAMVCAMVGHSKIQDICFGYYTCARCGAHLGDSWGGVYDPAPSVVIVGHNCDICRANYAGLGWEDRFLCPDPFEDGKEAAHDEE